MFYSIYTREWHINTGQWFPSDSSPCLPANLYHICMRMCGCEVSQETIISENINALVWLSSSRMTNWIILNSVSLLNSEFFSLHSAIQWSSIAPLQSTDAHQLWGLELQRHSEICFVRAFKHVVNIHGKYVLHMQTNCTHMVNTYPYRCAHIPCTYKTNHPKNNNNNAYQCVHEVLR